MTAPGPDCGLHQSDGTQSAYGLSMGYWAGSNGFPLQLGPGNFTGYECLVTGNPDQGPTYVQSSLINLTNPMSDNRIQTNITSYGINMSGQCNNSGLASRNYIKVNLPTTYHYTNATLVSALLTYEAAYTGGGVSVAYMNFYLDDALVGTVNCGVMGNGPQTNLTNVCGNTSSVHSFDFNSFSWAHHCQSLGGGGAWDVLHHFTIYNTSLGAAVDNIPVCSYSYNQSVFSPSPSNQYFVPLFNVSDVEGDAILYATSQTTTTSRYVLGHLDLTQYATCNVTGFYPNASCATNDASSSIVTSGFVNTGMTSTRYGSQAYWYSLQDSMWRYYLPAALTQSGGVMANFNLLNGVEVKFDLDDHSATPWLTLYVNQSNSRFLVKNSSGSIVINLSQSQFDPFSQLDFPTVTVDNNITTGKVIVGVISGSGNRTTWNTTAFGYMDTFQFVQLGPQSVNHWLLRDLVWSGYETATSLAWSSTAPQPILVDWTGSKILDFYITDDVHQDNGPYCHFKTTVTMLDTDSSVMPPTEELPQVGTGGPVATSPFGAFGNLFFGVINASGQSSFYAWGWFAYIVVLGILVLMGMEMFGAWMFTSIAFFILGLLSLTSWAQTITCLVFVLFGAAGAITKGMGPFGGVGGNVVGRKDGF